MINILVEVCREIRNTFATDKQTGEFHGIENGNFSLKDGKIAVKHKYVVGQYILIKNSILNDGIYRVEGFTDNVINLTQTAADYPDWIRPTGVPAAYSTGSRVRHNNLRWVSLQDINTIEPGWPGTNGVWWDIVPGVEIENPFSDEEFNGTIFSLRVPYDFLMTVEDILVFVNSSNGVASNVVSASFGIQSVSYATNASGARMSWQDVFRPSLNKYRRMTPDITL